MIYDLAITNGTVVSPEWGTFDADVGIEGERIAALSRSSSLRGEREIDATDRYVMPGAIDPHTHHGVVRDLADDAETESRSSLVGGVTTTGNIYRSGRPYTAIFDDLLAECEPNYYHDYFLTLAPFSTQHLREIPELIEDYGVISFKWYQRFKHRTKELFGVDRDMRDDYADDFVQALAEHPGDATLACHCENAEVTAARRTRVPDADKDEYESLIQAFPDYAETQGFVSGASLAKSHGLDDEFYAVHISAGRTADELATLRDAGYAVTGETCPHYLTFTTEECSRTHAARPPIRSAADRETLWKRLADGTIDCVGTDHCMKPADHKLGADVWSSETAFPGTATMLPLLLSEGVHEGRISLERAVAVVTTNTAKAWHLYPRKGSLRIGTDADLAIVDLEATKTVTPALCQSAADYTPYEGMAVTGWPTHTVVRGQVAFEQGEVVGERGHGTYLHRSST